ncbi:hypothetical protein PRZ48_012196 [Zasmidium cellare]|uniref:Uncharacterized protein n=1 Tax=Zasmidium cellare TaxID=395010 RepID=A0ABR0E468_ZASCE|nr:hypothetical protein PRZ48_012196 [Zasmidium cellare]
METDSATSPDKAELDDDWKAVSIDLGTETFGAYIGRWHPRRPVASRARQIRFPREKDTIGRMVAAWHDERFLFGNDLLHKVEIGEVPSHKMMKCWKLLLYDRGTGTVRAKRVLCQLEEARKTFSELLEAVLKQIWEGVRGDEALRNVLPDPRRTIVYFPVPQLATHDATGKIEAAAKKVGIRRVRFVYESLCAGAAILNALLGDHPTEDLYSQMFIILSGGPSDNDYIVDGVQEQLRSDGVVVKRPKMLYGENMVAKGALMIDDKVDQSATIADHSIGLLNVEEDPDPVLHPDAFLKNGDLNKKIVEYNPLCSVKPGVVSKYVVIDRIKWLVYKGQTANEKGDFTTSESPGEIQLFHTHVENPVITFYVVFTKIDDTVQHEPLRSQDGKTRPEFTVKKRVVKLSREFVERFGEGWAKRADKLEYDSGAWEEIYDAITDTNVVDTRLPLGNWALGNASTSFGSGPSHQDLRQTSSTSGPSQASSTGRASDERTLQQIAQEACNTAPYWTRSQGRHLETIENAPGLSQTKRQGKKRSLDDEVDYEDIDDCVNTMMSRVTRSPTYGRSLRGSIDAPGAKSPRL